MYLFGDSSFYSFIPSGEYKDYQGWQGKKPGVFFFVGAGVAVSVPAGLTGVPAVSITPSAGVVSGTTPPLSGS